MKHQEKNNTPQQARRSHDTSLRKRYFLYLVLEVFLLTGAGVFFFSIDAKATVGENFTLGTNLTVGNPAPEVVNITFMNSFAQNGVTLSANSTVTVTIEAVLRDYSGEDQILNASAFFFDSSSTPLDGDDNNNHYSNFTCGLDPTFGDIYEVNATCTFSVWYYANNASWNVSVYVNDIDGLQNTGTARTRVNTLLSVGLPNQLDYGLVNATAVSREYQVNISNFGNVPINFSVLAYGSNESDGLAMNCTQGMLKNISAYYEKYNLTASNPSDLSLTQFEGLYFNATNISVVRKYNLAYRQNEVAHDSYNSTYWRIYVPTGVAGSCQGHILIGATQRLGT